MDFKRGERLTAVRARRDALLALSASALEQLGLSHARLRGAAPSATGMRRWMGAPASTPKAMTEEVVALVRDTLSRSFVEERVRPLLAQPVTQGPWEGRGGPRGLSASDRAIMVQIFEACRPSLPSIHRPVQPMPSQQGGCDCVGFHPAVPQDSVSAMDEAHSLEVAANYAYDEAVGECRAATSGALALAASRSQGLSGDLSADMYQQQLSGPPPLQAL